MLYKGILCVMKWPNGLVNSHGPPEPQALTLTRVGKSETFQFSCFCHLQILNSPRAPTWKQPGWRCSSKTCISLSAPMMPLNPSNKLHGPSVSAWHSAQKNFRVWFIGPQNIFHYPSASLKGALVQITGGGGGGGSDGAHMASFCQTELFYFPFWIIPQTIITDWEFWRLLRPHTG